ncbi:alpha/beta hydrolase [Sphingomonas sp.]|uniref:alpha/beta hydrolase n=1 Tax=Sphingomonas sp. TaxID=28214 RepID=UPI003B3A8C7E
MTHILYRSPALEVRHVPAGDGRRQVVTFDSYHEQPGVDRPGFGEAFFAGENVGAIHILSHSNDWFQHTDIPEVLSIIRDVCGKSDRLLTYGSSMGGYAALRFASALGAGAALALSPQYSVDPRKAPFETRWASDRRRIRFIDSLEGAIQPVPLMVVAYDPSLPEDREHVHCLAREISELQTLPLPFAGHPVGPFLQDVELLRATVLDVLEGRFDAERYRLSARSQARHSPHWLANLAERHPRATGGRDIALARRAVALAPDRPNLHDILARRLAAAGHYAEAVEAHHKAIAIEPIVDYLWGLSKTLVASGDVAAALIVAERMRALAPSVAGYHAWAAKLYEAQGDILSALAAIEEAVRHDRTNLRYRSMALGLRSKLQFRRLRALIRR